MKKSSVTVSQPAFSNWLREKRQKKNLTKADLIRLAHGRLSPRTIKTLENGRDTHFRESTLMELAQLLDIPFDVFNAEIKKLDIRSGKNNIRKKSYYLLFSTALIAYAIVWIFNFQGYREPFEVEFSSQSVRIFDPEKNLLFAKKDPSPRKIGIINDINEDGEKEVILALNKPVKGAAMVFDYKGNELWRVNPFKKIFYQSGGLTSHYRTSGIVVGTFLHNGAKQLLLTYQEIGWFPSGLIILDHNGNELTRYWHPGHITNTKYNMENNLVAISAYNNHYKKEKITTKYPNCVALFNADNITGQAPPYHGDGPKRGSHLWYIEFEPTGSKVTGINFIDYQSDNSIDIQVNLDSHYYLIFNTQGKLFVELPADNYNGKKYSFKYHH